MNFEPEPALLILETIAEKYPKTSAEYAAMVLSAKAVLFIHAKSLSQDFENYLNILDAELSHEQTEFLKEIGFYSD